MKRLGFCVLILFGLFYFSEGKPCPEKFRSHKTRCEIYYKCIVLPTKMHVWVPKHCAQGLVYEPNLQRCVLPGEDWECVLLDEQSSSAPTATASTSTSAAHEGLAAANASQTLSDIKVENQSVELNGMDIYIVGGGGGAAAAAAAAAEDDADDVLSHDRKPSLAHASNQQSDDIIEVVDDIDYEASGDDEVALVEVDGFLQAEEATTTKSATITPPTLPAPTLPSPTTTTTTTITTTTSATSMEQKEMLEGNDLLTTTTATTPHNHAAAIDPKLTEHLQRLSQLIDGLKQTYQSTDAPHYDLRPDQLNAFLSHFNIKSKFDNINVSGGGGGGGGVGVSGSGESMERNNNTTSITTTASGNLRPETKVVITRHHYPQRYDGEEYTNSHIVVNRPEGSVLFNLPAYAQQQQQQQLQQQQQQLLMHYNNNNGLATSPSSSHDNTPKISEETLKTVLELSKQMIANQNMPKLIPNTAAYYTPSILQPVFLPPPPPPPHQLPQSAVNPYSLYYSHNNNNNNDNDIDDYGYNISATGLYTGLHNGYYGQRRRHPTRPSARPQGAATGKPLPPPPATTIIHNVIPVHLSGGGNTNSAENELLDSYGQRLSLYPALGLTDDGNSPFAQRYETNKYIASITTVRPIIGGGPAPTAATASLAPSPSVAAYPPQPTSIGVAAYPPYSQLGGVTTARPFEHQPSPATIAEFYTPSPHLSDSNANSLFHAPAHTYPTVSSGGGGGGGSHRYGEHAQHAIAAPLFPSISPNKVKIRPNAQKLESAEMLDDGDDLASYSNHQHQHQHQHHQYDDVDGDDEDNDLKVNDLYNTASNSYKPYTPPPYMPRPSAATSAAAASSALSSSIFNGNGGASAAAAAHNHQLVNVGGHFISLDVFRNSILPLLGRRQSLANFGNVEVITCAPGIRQANMTDCTRYYVCSKKDGKVLSYSCPPYTAFNEQTRICDARTYAQCGDEAALLGGGGGGGYGTSPHRRTQLDAIKAMQEAKRRREQALKAQTINSLLNQLESSSGGGISGGGNFIVNNSEEDRVDLLSSYVQQAQLLASSGTTTARPAASSSSSSNSGSTYRPPTKKRKYYCKEGDKIADQTSVQHYFVCYKNAQGMMKGHKMACTKGLVFCARTSMCTLLSKCTT